MKVGDAVALDWRVTRKGYPHEEQVGIIIRMRDADGGNIQLAVVNFAGNVITLTTKHLRVVSEGR